MANGIGQNIEAVDYNSIRNKISLILGAGAGQFGYGQSLISTAVTSGNDITAEQWANLRWDIYNTRIHQDGAVPSIVLPQTGDAIRFGSSNPNNQYDAQCELASVNKFNIGVGQFVVDSAVSTIRNTSWSNSVSCTVTVAFANADQARWFFNSGGQIRFNSLRSDGGSLNQNETWSAILERIGTLSFSANSSVLNFYSLTNSNQTFYSTDVRSIYLGSSPYADNNYVIRALCDVTDNSQGGATTIVFTITWQDQYIDSNPNPPPDLVDGNLSLIVTELRASGILQNGTGSPGVFSITRPNYSITPIIGS